MKVCLPVLVMLLIMTDVALGAVGGGSVSDGTSSLQPVNGYSTGATGNAFAGAATPSVGPASGGSLAASLGAYVPIQSESYQNVYPESSSSMSGSYQDSYSPQKGIQGGIQPSQAAPSAEAVVSSAPQINGPYQEGMSADDLRLSQPQADSFRPDEALGFVSASLPSNLNPNPNTLDTGANAAAYGSTYGATQGTALASSSWYYPSSIRSPNRFYVQTSSGLRTVGGCSYGGYLPLWSDINSGGNFFVYEWYPGSSTPTAQWWGWSWTGFKKGWFYGDAPGWHILVYNCRYWSNYIYIYVYPVNANYPNPYSGASPGSYASTAYSGTGTATNPYSGGYGAVSGYTGNAGMMGQTALPSGAPTPPSPGSESLALPDYSTYTPYTDQAMQAAYAGSGYPAQAAISAPTGSGYSGYPAQTVMSTSAMSGYSGYPSKSCTTCTGSTAAVGGVSGTYPSRGSCPTCTAGSGLTAPYGYVPQSYQAVYPKPSTCRCNEYYVQYYPNRISTVAGMYCDMWLPLWSKISRPGVYWSYEWTCSGSGYYSSPEIRNFGYKNSGWYQTWFGSSNPGWHILSYHCNDWSNYIYIYVWPTS